MAFFHRFSTGLIECLEDLFYRWGKLVTRHPYPVILTSITATVLCSLGFLVFRIEHKANLLWIPADSDYNTKQDWLDQHFESQSRDEIMLFSNENVLTPESIKEMYRLYERVQNITVNGKTFNDICEPVPIADIFQTKRRRKREANAPRRGKILLSGDDLALSNDTNNDYNDSDDYYDDDVYDFWAGEYDYDEDGNSEPKEILEKPRIDFKRYGKKNDALTSDSVKSVTDGLPKNIYCDLVQTLNTKCVQTSLLEMWRYDKELIMSTTQQEILDAVNNLNKSPWYGYSHDYTKILGGITRNASGHVTGARVAQVFWRLEIPDDVEVVHNQGSGLELQLADKYTLEWEQKFIEIGLNSSTATTTVLPNAAKSFGDVSGEAIFFDAFFMAGGYIIMFIYTIVMLGKMNLIHVRLYLTLTGLLSIAMGMIISMGLSSLLGCPYTPMHAVLPFICLGIGIDDMFVIVTSYYNILKTGENLSIGEKIGRTMRHAGVSVTVTSFTDVFAFGVGAITKMPGLQSFCVSTAIALGCIYILQVSWFVAWLVLDEKRIVNNRNGLVPCITHSQTSQESCCTRLDISATFLKFYSKLLSSRVFQGAILLLTLTFTGVGIGGSNLIRQKFEPELLLPAESYLRRWKDLHDAWYPENGWSAEIYTGHINHTHLLAMDRLVNSLEKVVEDKQYLRGVYPWWNSFKDYTETKTNLSSWTEMTTEPDLFPRLLSDWLYDASGSGHKPEFRFSGDLSCDTPAPRIEATKIKFAYLLFDGPEEHVPAKRKVEQLIKDSGLEGSFSFVKIYAAWETDEIIGQELWRNIGLALAAIFTVIVILLANLKISLMVFLTVVLTLVDIVGFLHFWDITIDIISCVNIVLAVGLCVDYSVHIGHAFLVSPGSSGERTVTALATIGSAVFNGGFTTFLALVLLGFSTSHVFISFFKVFSLTVIFGLYHGLVLLPVLLFILGPDKEEEADKVQSGGQEGTNNNYGTRGHDNLVFVQEGGNKNHVWT